jgi:DNA-binding transcriptional LysR family regulator
MLPSCCVGGSPAKLAEQEGVDLYSLYIAVITCELSVELNFHQLRLFYSVARSGSMSRAAEELHISQPSISAQVRELELRCGFDLFHRLPRGVILTEAGRLVLDHAERIFVEAGALKARLQGLATQTVGKLTVGGSLTAGEYFLPTVVARFRIRWPEIGLVLSLENSTTIVRKIVRGELDWGFVGTETVPDALASVPCWQDEIVIIAPPQAVSRTSLPLTCRALEAQPFVLREPGSATRAHIERTLRGHGVTIREAAVVGSPEAVKRHVAAGLGWGFASKASVTTELDLGRLAVVPVREWQCLRTFCAVYRTGYRLSPAQSQFLELARLLC